jgi:hypothetical protein
MSNKQDPEDDTIRFKTDIEHNGKRITVKVEASYSPGYSEQEYPGAHTWHYKSSMDIESVTTEDGTEILEQITSQVETNLQKAAFNVLAGEKPSSEFDYEDRCENLDAQRFEDMAYGPRDDDF